MVKLPGKVCIRSATVLSFLALLLLIFPHVGQRGTVAVQRSISMAQLNMSAYGDGLHAVLIDPIVGLYADNGSTPLGIHGGLRQVYKFGMYGHCAYVGKDGACAGGSRFLPYDVITSDMSANYSRFSEALLANTTLANDGYLGSKTQPASILISMGMAFALLATVASLWMRIYAFCFSTVFALLASLCLFIGAIIWTTVLKKAEAINTDVVGSGSAGPVNLGLELTAGSGLYLVWAAFALMICSNAPYILSCWSFRG